TSSSTVKHSIFATDANGRLASASVFDSIWRTITYVDNALGEVVSRTDTSGPLELYYYLNGDQVGDVGNDGPSQTDYLGTVIKHGSTPPVSPWSNGASSVSYANFDENFQYINQNSPSQPGQSYLVHDGDTLHSIAAAVWGD